MGWHFFTALADAPREHADLPEGVRSYATGFCAESFDSRSPVFNQNQMLSIRMQRPVLEDARLARYFREGQENPRGALMRLQDALKDLEPQVRVKNGGHFVFEGKSFFHVNYQTTMLTEIGAVADALDYLVLTPIERSPLFVLSSQQLSGENK